jgi:hypothetical protein
MFRKKELKVGLFLRLGKRPDTAAQLEIPTR